MTERPNTFQWLEDSSAGLSMSHKQQVRLVLLDPCSYLVQGEAGAGGLTVAPCLLAMSADLIPQIPLFAIKTVFPGSGRLVITHSMAACPVADRARLMGFLVWKMYCTPAFTSSII